MEFSLAGGIVVKGEDEEEERHSVWYRLHWLIFDGWQVVGFLLSGALLIYAIWLFFIGRWPWALGVLFIGEPIVIFGGRVLLTVITIPFRIIADDEIAEEFDRREFR